MDTTRTPDTVRTLIDGVIAGVLGALAIAIWFLIFDFGRGQPLATPSLLGALLLNGGHAVGGVSPLYVAEYTLLHFAVFAVVGLIIGALVLLAQHSRDFLFGLLIFLAAFEVFFIGMLTVAAPAASSGISGWAVLVGNLLATAIFLAYFAVRAPELVQNMLGHGCQVFAQGVEAGVLGGVIVAIWFALSDLALGAPLRTPAMLGAAFFKLIPLAPGMHSYAALVGGYTVLHFAAFIVIGVIAACLLEWSERQPLLLTGMFVLFVCFEVFFIVMVLALTSASLIAALTWWRIIVGDVLATIGMGAYFYSRHRALGGRMLRAWAQQESPPLALVRTQTRN